MGGATETPTRRRPSGPRSGPGGAWNVIVLDDDHNTFDGVAHALSAVLPGVTYERGMAFANKVHSSGSALVWSGHRELAELYWSQLRDFGLTMAPLDRH